MSYLKQCQSDVYISIDVNVIQQFQSHVYLFIDLPKLRNVLKQKNQIWFQSCRHSRDPCPVQLEESADRPQHVPRSTETPIPVLRPERFRKNDLRLRGSGSI